MRAAVLSVLLVAAAAIAASAERPFPKPTFGCTPLPPPPAPVDVLHLRPGNIKAIGALGDSISAGFGMLDTPFEERQRVFDIGGEDGALTVANYLATYNPDLLGVSTHDTIPLTKGSQGDAAVSEARVEQLLPQVDFLINEFKSLKFLDYNNDWKLVTILIGANNICPACHNRTDTTPDFFETNLRQAIEKLRSGMPKVFVNVMTMLNVSQVWYIAHEHPYCSTVEHKIIECGCLNDDNDGENLRLMDLAAGEFNARIRKIAADYQAMNLTDFTVVAQPGIEGINMADFPDSFAYLSHLDCFHPSLYANEAFSIALWNNMMTPEGKKANTLNLDSIHYICPSSDSYLQ